MWQPGWERSLGENGYVYMCGEEFGGEWAAFLPSSLLSSLPAGGGVRLHSSNPALPLALTGSLQGCNVTLGISFFLSFFLFGGGIYFWKNQAALREKALIRPSIGSFWEQFVNQILFGKLSPPPSRQLDNSLPWWNFLPQDIPATEFQNTSQQSPETETAFRSH